MPRKTPLKNVKVENLVKRKPVLKEDESDEDVYEESHELVDLTEKSVSKGNGSDPKDELAEALDVKLAGLLEKKLSLFQEQLINKLSEDRLKRAADKKKAKEVELREKELARINKESAKKSDLEYLTKIITHNKEVLTDQIRRDEQTKYIDRINNLRKSSLMF